MRFPAGAISFRETERASMNTEAVRPTGKPAVLVEGRRIQGTFESG